MGCIIGEGGPESNGYFSDSEVSVFRNGHKGPDGSRSDYDLETQSRGREGTRGTTSNRF